jgi:NAD(P)-dependent dehydrogenase (short-subunit alcohol dehydrogenase family)
MSFVGRIAVVTGGASGIGAACCRMLAARGAQVVVADLDAPRAGALAAELGGMALTLDVGSRDANETAAAEVEARLGPVELLVTSAGIIQRPVRAEAMSEAEVEQVVRVDQIGTFHSAVAFGARMARRGRGAIVTIASIAGMRSMPLHAYAPAKAAVIEMTRCLAAEWGRSGVRVNAVSPGYTLTPALGAAIEAGERDPTLLEQTSALGRMVTPDDIAEACASWPRMQRAASPGSTYRWMRAGSPPLLGSYGGLPPPWATA